MKRNGLIVALLLALLMTAFWSKGGLVALPDVPERAEPGAFDTKRALARLRRVLGDERPHPVDSEAGDAVRERLLAELRAIGLSPAVTDDFACNGTAKSRAVSCARVRNVLASLGPAEGRAVMMVSHYDSTPVGPGAADDGIGVAAMLEIAALLKDRPLKRPVLLLFNEGEEAGLIGARAFLERNPLARRVDAVVNLEARGVTGPALMFETSRPNGSAVAAFARAAERPSANSASADFYRLIPNDTDVSVFHGQPWTILNFAIIGNETRYHSPEDRFAALDPRSLRHMGVQALSATERLATDGVPAAASGNKLYMDLLGRALVVLPVAPGIGLLVGLLAAFAWLAWRRRDGVPLAAATIVVGLLDAAILGFLGQTVVGLLRRGEYWRAHPEVTALALYLSALAACTFALIALARGLARDRLRIAYWLVFLLLGAGLAFLVPGATIYFLAPPLVAGAAMLAGRWERPAALAAWALLFLSWGPLLHLSEILLDLDKGWIFAALAALILWPILIEMKPLLVRLPRVPAFGAVAAIVLLGWVGAMIAPAYAEDRKQALGIEYAAHWTGSALWLLATDGALPEGLDHFTKVTDMPWRGRTRWASHARFRPVPAPAVEIMGKAAHPRGRLVTFRLRTNGAESVILRIGAHARVQAVWAGGPAVRFGRDGSNEDDFVLRCVGRSCDGRALRLLIGVGQPVDADLIGQRSGLPAEAVHLIRARPALSAPQYNPDLTMTIGRVRL